MSSGSETPATAVPAPASPAGPPPLGVTVRMLAVAALGVVGGITSSQGFALAAPDLAGALGVSADEASWITTAATMAEVAVVPLVALLARALSLRRLALIGVTVYLAASALGFAVASLPAMIAIRAAQAFAGGTFPVLMMVTVMASLPPGPRRRAGLAAFAFATSLPLALATGLTGALLDRFGWHGLLGFQIAWALPYLGLTLCFVPRQHGQAGILREADWTGYAALAVGCMALLLLLGQGERRFWWSNPMITAAGLVAAPSLALALLWMLRAGRPLLDLSLLVRPTFGWSLLLAVCLRFGVLVSTFVLPQALARLQGFRLPEIGEATLWMGLGQLAAFPLTWWWASRLDARSTLALGLALFAAAAWLAGDMDPTWQGGQFRPSLVALGTAQGFFLVSLLYFATSGVAPAQGATAATLFNLARVIGQALGTAAVATLVTEREKGHSAMLVEAISDANLATAERITSLAQTYRSIQPDATFAEAQALRALAVQASNQAYALAFNDAFLVIAALMATSTYLVLLLPRLPDDPQIGGSR